GTFIIRVKPSSETNDYEVRFYGDEQDLIEKYWNDMIGLDPDQILINPSPIKPNIESQIATIARCNCGETGCGSVEVEIRREGEEILWTNGGTILSFPGASYLVELDRARTDLSWETPERTLAR